MPCLRQAWGKGGKYNDYRNVQVLETLFNTGLRYWFISQAQSNLSEASFQEKGKSHRSSHIYQAIFFLDMAHDFSSLDYRNEKTY